MIRGEDKEKNPFIDLQSASIVITSAALGPRPASAPWTYSYSYMCFIVSIILYMTTTTERIKIFVNYLSLFNFP